jgi:DNA gyrase subunit A
MGRATSGVIGMRFREDDELLSMNVVKEGTFVFTATSGGFGKRTAVERYPVRGRGGLGVIAAKTVDLRGGLVGALIVEENDEVLAITASGGVIRTNVSGMRETGRDTMGVQLIHVGKRDAVIGIARNAESSAEAVEVIEDGELSDDADPTASATANTSTDSDGAEQPPGEGGTVSEAEPMTPDEA